jgi:GTP-binding protein
LPEVAFAGRSNVGKSSALNRLLGAKSAARVSSTPGRTQAINLFQLGAAGVFADLPGYGFASVPDAVKSGWKQMIEDYLGKREALRLVVLLIDCRRPVQEADGMLRYALVESGIPSLVVATKVDKLTRNQRTTAFAELRRDLRLPAGEPVPFSAVSGEGFDPVWDRIEAAFAAAPIERTADPDVEMPQG